MTDSIDTAKTTTIELEDGKTYRIEDFLNAVKNKFVIQTVCSCDDGADIDTTVTFLSREEDVDGFFWDYLDKTIFQSDEELSVREYGGDKNTFFILEKFSCFQGRGYRNNQDSITVSNVTQSQIKKLEELCVYFKSKRGLKY